MDPITAGLFVAASFASSVISNRNQAKVEAASINMQVAQSNLQSQEAAYERTKEFRKNISSNLALSGMGFGGVSGFRGIASEEASNYFSDILSLQNTNLFANAQATGARAYSKAKRFTNTLNAATDAATLASQLGLFSSKAKK